MKTHIFLFALILSLALAPLPLAAQESPKGPPQAEPAVGEELGYGFGSVVANFFYIPAKVTYAGLGLLTGGLGYVVSGGRPDVANNIIYPAVRGNYVITPNHLKGVEPVIFVGPPPSGGSQPVEMSSTNPPTQP